MTSRHGKQVVMISGKEGLFALKVPKKLDGQWQHEHLLDHEVSDTYSYDVDRDGTPEIVTIEPFHGDRLVMYKSFAGEWKSIFETSLNFGHVVWAGKILDKPAVLGGSRGGKKELFLLSSKTNNVRDMRCKILDSNVGPTQVRVIQKKNCTIILSANHAANEIALYKLTP